MKNLSGWVLAIFIISIIACQTDQDIKTNSGILQFSLLEPSSTKVKFQNNIKESLNFNFLNYTNIYNGAGVSIADINNDGLDDIFLVSNQQGNKLFLNQNNLEFEDISKQAGIEDPIGWKTGISAVDINNDGWMDFYVCKSASRADQNLRKNKLFINQKNNTFLDQAEAYGLADPAFSMQSYFFDYDNDGDLDMYLVNHRVDFKNTERINTEIERGISILTSDQFYINNGGKFRALAPNGFNKTWGLSASVADYNQDGWLDIFVCNDFLQADHLLINTQEGFFKDSILHMIDHISFYSMGSDVADINNDMLPDLVSLDMAVQDHKRSKQNMASMNVSQFNQLVELGYHHQYMSNNLHLNRGGGHFSEIGFFAGISKTDWSWAPLLADYDNDGDKDLFITNGIRRDITNNDFKNDVKARNQRGESMLLDDLLALVPSQKLNNYMYRNDSEAKFSDQSENWGFNHESFSSGVAYSDLDNDGDLDLVINNMDGPANIFRNNSENNYLKIKLQGPQSNINGLGAEVISYTQGEQQYYQHFTTRGYLSSVSNNIVIGIGDHKLIDSLRVIWPGGKSEMLSQLKANQTINLSILNAKESPPRTQAKSNLIARVKDNLPIDYKHEENDYNDFDREVLLPQKYSTLGPNAIIGDVNGDKLEDVFVTGARGFSAKLYTQKPDGSFNLINQNFWESERAFEDTNALLFDCDQDGDLDLYVTSGGNESQANLPIYQDRLYTNDGNGNFVKSKSALPKVNASTKAICSGDFDQDGDLDLFVGGRVVPGAYPTAPESYLLENQNGAFKNITSLKASGLKDLGMVTDAIFTDHDNDMDLDLMLVGEWMEPVVFVNDGTSFKKQSLLREKNAGWWHSINSADLNNDGLLDYVIGNLGLNNKFKPSKDKPFHVYSADFDDNGQLDIVLANQSNDVLLPVRGKECSSQQMPSINDQFKTYKSFSEADINLIYSEEKVRSALHYEVQEFASVVLINKGNGSFEKQKLPMVSQYGPLLSSIIYDVDGDGFLDIIGAGNIYETEPETVRYDASKGFILLNDQKGSFIETVNHDFLTDGNVKDLALINIGNQKVILSLANNGPMELFKMNN